LQQQDFGFRARLDLETTIRRSQDYLLREQKPEGYWVGELMVDATLVADTTGIIPLLLLDEVVAHLDPHRRKALFDELAKLGAQVRMTGADPAAFADIGPTGEIFDVESGRVARRG